MTLLPSVWAVVPGYSTGAGAASASEEPLGSSGGVVVLAQVEPGGAEVPYPAGHVSKPKASALSMGSFSESSWAQQKCPARQAKIDCGATFI